MRLKLKENPKQWRKFVVAWTVIPLSGIWFIVPFLPKSVIAAFVAVLAVGVIFPQTMRIPYRAVMTVSFYVGQVIGRISLTLFFLLMVTPLGLLLRALGKDLLQIKKVPRDSYWEKPSAESAHDRMF